MIFNIDKLYNAVKTKGHVCVGLDTCIDYVPALERSSALNDAQAVLAYNRTLIDATYDIASCYKVQIAYYEEMGLEGLKAYSETLKYIKNKNCLAIADIKRGDIADTASRYVKAHFTGDFEADFVTISPYMGMDSVEPWIKEAKTLGKGAFVLMRTSNPGMRDFQYLTITENNKRVYNAVGDKLASLASQYCGECGYGLFGAVVGCTEREEAAEIRKNYSNLFFLIPGYGAQGGGAKDACILLREGNGGVVNASRSIIAAWKSVNHENSQVNNDFAAEAARNAAIKMRDEIKNEL
ncbi:MAG: orotidine-5'-phosphate decarboxylase [Treponema sp.]|nr:orotidine-5'-phosphate decarboxylase [Treponema sp.]MCL2250952.1 orotidine-5'-phosphate decarboxylase [Treponema sp.]